MQYISKIPLVKPPEKKWAQFIGTSAIVAKMCIVCALFFAVSGCVKQNSSPAKIDEEEDLQESITSQEQEKVDEEPVVEEPSATLFYYYAGEKIFLQQIKEKVCIKFAPDVSKEQLQILIVSDASLKSTSDTYLEDGSLRFAVLESIDGKQIPLATIELFKLRPEVVSANYLYRHNGGKLQAITDEFIVKLGGATSYDQLKELAEQHNCVVGKENQFVKNQYMLYVSKTSDFNAIQMSNLFYETGLFEFSEPNSILLNAFGVFVNF